MKEKKNCGTTFVIHHRHVPDSPMASAGLSTASFPSSYLRPHRPIKRLQSSVSHPEYLVFHIMAPRVRLESKSFIFKTALCESEEIEQNFSRDRGRKMAGHGHASKRGPSRTTQQRNISVAKASEGMPEKYHASMQHVTEERFPGEGAGQSERQTSPGFGPETSQSAWIGDWSYFFRVRDLKTLGTSAWAFGEYLATSRIR